MKKINTLLFTLLILTTSVLQAAINQAIVKVGGMVCVACTSVVGNHLKKIDGIKAVSDIDFKTGTVTIEFTPDNTFTKKKLRRALQKALKESTYKFEKIIEIK